jgi:basic amino acid/polyamine antiporter, APA family
LGPYVIPVLSVVAVLFLIFFLAFGNPLVGGWFPIVWLVFLIWFAIGLIFYFSYGRRKSTVALEEMEGLAVAQPRVN